MNDTLKQQTVLVYPAHWSAETVDRYERLHSLKKVTQADVDEIAARLEWYREWRDYFATTNGQDLTGLRKASGE